MVKHGEGSPASSCDECRTAPSYEAIYGLVLPTPTIDIYYSPVTLKTDSCCIISLSVKDHKYKVVLPVLQGCSS